MSALPMTQLPVDHPPLDGEPKSSTIDLETGSKEHRSITNDDACGDHNDDDDDEARSGVDLEFRVWWNGPDDPENPLNWTAGRKWSIIGCLSFITFLTPLASSMLAPGVPLILTDFRVTNNSLATFVVSVFVLGFALGPLVVAPMSELYGRNPVYHTTNVLFVLFTVLCAVSQNMDMLIAFRFFAGFAGVAVITCGGGSISDLMPPERRGAAMAIWSLGPLLGPVVGPVCAGFVVEAVGWRWVFWIVTILGGVATLAAFAVLRETYAPAILERKAARLRRETGDARHQSGLKKAGTPRELFLAAIVRPARMLVLSPVVLVVCLHVALVYGILYLLFTTFAFVYRDIYGFSAVGAGLSFIGAGVGNLIGLVYMGTLSDRVLVSKRKAGGAIRPEDRLHWLLSVPTSFCIPVGLLMYGWTADRHVHWVAPMVATGIIGYGMIGVLMCTQVYLVDAFTEHAASVTAANTVLRSLVGALLPLSGLQLYEALGLGWGNTLLGLLALLLSPVPVLLWAFGERIRTSPRFQRQF